jgi:GNAT superfamily N-acetyltransferase
MPDLAMATIHVLARPRDVQHNRSVKTMNAVTIRPATLADLPLLLRHRRAMAEEMDTPDPVAVNRMIRALEPYLRSAIPEGRWHAWIAEPGGCGAVEIVQWVPGRLDPTPRRAWIHSLYIEPSFRSRGIGRRLTETMVTWCREQGFRWIYLHASEQGRPLYEALGFERSSEMRLKL